jgi:hypothetical protein
MISGLKSSIVAASASGRTRPGGDHPEGLAVTAEQGLRPVLALRPGEDLAEVMGVRHAAGRDDRMSVD